MKITAQTSVRVIEASEAGAVIVSGASLGDVLKFRGVAPLARRRIYAELAEGGTSHIGGYAENSHGYEIEVVA